MNDLNNLLEQITSDFSLNNYGSEAVKQQLNLMLETMSLSKITNKNITWNDLDDLTETIYFYSNDKAAAQNELYPEYKQIRDYLNGRKIHYRPEDKAEFSDDWKRISCIIGLKTLTKQPGGDILEALDEINDLVGCIFDTECNTQMGFIQLVSYLQNIPSKYACFVKSLKFNGYELPAMVADALHNSKQEAGSFKWTVKKVNYRVEENKQYKSKEIYFDDIPTKETREALKKLKFRWHNVKKCWYGFASLEAIKAAC